MGDGQDKETSLRGKPVLVTGAAGFIGSHLTEALVDAGASVTAMLHYNANSSIGNLAFLPGEKLARVKVIAGNIEDETFVRGALAGQQVVFHLAALIAIPYSYLAPRSYVRTNVEGTLNVLEAARSSGVERVVHTSTSEVYGTALTVPIDEGHPLQGQSPYSASKIGADKMAESYFLSFGTPVVTLRPFNTFGPRQSARAFIPTIISQALAGSSVRLGALEPERDMTYVSDTVAGYLAAATSPGVLGETINLGTGHALSIGAFAQAIFSLMDVKREIVTDPDRIRPARSEVGRLVSDNGKAGRLMGWRPRVSVEEGLLRTIAFVRENPGFFSPARYAV